MWNHASLCKVLALAIFAMSIMGFKINKPLSREQIYLEVLKNITHVHNILNELLVNYKHLKEVYEAQAKAQNQFSGEIKIDDEDEQTNRTDLINDPEYHPVTQMILFDEGLLDDNSDKSNESIDDKENVKPDLIDNAKLGEKKEKELEGKSVTPNINNIDLSITESLLQNKRPNVEPAMNLSDKPELLIVGTALKYPNNMPHTKNIKNNDIKTVLVPKDLNKSILSKDYNDNLKVRHNKNRYKHINQPRKLWNPKEFSLHQGDRKIDIKNEPNNKTVLVLIVNKEQKHRLFKSNLYNSDSEKGEEETLIREQVERNILRDAYGSACLKVAVRKCYKTLTLVKKLICTMGFKCKNSFKNNFKSFSKTGCKNEFNYKGNEENKQKLPYDRKQKRKKDKTRTPDDSTRTNSDVNYYELCLPVMMSDETNTDNTTIEEIPPRDLSKLQPINVLRDRYEKECKRLSTEKCVRACNFAVTSACGQSPCERTDKKYFFRTCRKECKQAFGGGRDSNNDDSDSDDSDSDDNDDSDDSDDDDDDDSVTFE